MIHFLTLLGSLIAFASLLIAIVHYAKKYAVTDLEKKMAEQELRHHIDTATKQHEITVKYDTIIKNTPDDWNTVIQLHPENTANTRTHPDKL